MCLYDRNIRILPKKSEEWEVYLLYFADNGSGFQFRFTEIGDVL